MVELTSKIILVVLMIAGATFLIILMIGFVKFSLWMFFITEDKSEDKPIEDLLSLIKKKKDNPSLEEVAIISEDDMLRFGFFPIENGHDIIYEKVISEKGNDPALQPMKLALVNTYGTPEFCLFLCEGQRLYLQINSLEELAIIEKSINRYEPVW